MTEQQPTPHTSARNLSTWKFIKENYHIILLLLLFLSGFFVRVNITGGVDYSYPGNIKASDPFFHTHQALNVAENGNFFVHPFYNSRVPNGADGVPYFQSGIAGAIISLTGIAEWNVLYLIVALFSALSIVLIYLAGFYLFNSKDAGLLAAALVTFPPNPGTWLYYTYIGIYLNSSGIVFTLLTAVLLKKSVRQTNTT